MPNYPSPPRCGGIVPGEPSLPPSHGSMAAQYHPGDPSRCLPAAPREASARRYPLHALSVPNIPSSVHGKTPARSAAAAVPAPEGLQSRRRKLLEEDGPVIQASKRQRQRYVTKVASAR